MEAKDYFQGEPHTHAPTGPTCSPVTCITTHKYTPNTQYTRSLQILEPMGSQKC